MERVTAAGPAGRAMTAAALAGAAASALGALTGVTAASFAGACVGFGLMPGLAAVRFLASGERGVVPVSRALFLSPFLSGLAATALLLAGLDPGTAAAAILVAAYAAGLGAAVLPRRAAATEANAAAGRVSHDERRLIWWMIALAALALVPHLREWIRIRSDAWFHEAVVLEIDARGVPPQDPYFAGLRLQYMWVYHALLAVWSRAAGTEAWNLGGALNAIWLTSLGGGVYALSRRVGRPAREAVFAAIFVPLGLGALFTLWLPLKVLRAAVGETRGMAELGPAFSLSPFGIDRVFHVMSSFHSPPPLLNKYLVMTALGGAITGLVWLAEGLVGWVRRPAAGRAVWTVLVMAAVWIWNPALALGGALGCGLGGLWLLARPGREPPARIARPRVLAAALWVALGSAAVAPLLLSAASNTAGPFPIGFDRSTVVPILVSSLAAVLFGIPALSRLRPTAAARAFQALAAGFMIAAFLVVLPEPNARDKMPFVFYLLPATAAGWMLGALFHAWRRRGRRAAAWVVLLLILVPATALTWTGYLFDPADRRISPDEAALYEWLRLETPPDAVILDSDDRDDVVVRVPRRQYWGREAYARLWSYAPAVMDRRRMVRDTLLGPPAARPDGGPGSARPDAASYGRAVAALRGFAREDDVPVFVLWRPADHGGSDGIPGALGDRSLFTQAWSNPAATVLRLRPLEDRP